MAATGLVRAVRETLRRWQHRPLLAVFGIASVAAVIAINTVVFAVVDAVVYKPLPVANAATLYDICSTEPWPRNMVFYPRDYPEIRRRADGTVIRDVIAFGYVEAFLSHPVAGRRLVGEAVSPNYFSALGLAPQVGTFGSLGDEGADTACIISDSLWRSAFGRDPRVLGQAVTLNGVSFEVAAVAPRGFRGLFAPNLLRTDFWMAIPAAIRVPHGKTTPSVRLALRVGNDVPPSLVSMALPRVVPRELQMDKTDRPYVRFRGVVRATPEMDRRLAAAAVVALLGVGGLLVAVCANLTVLMLTAAWQRRPELRLRRALGARRRDLVVHAAVEPVLMAGIGGVLGLLVGKALLLLVASQQPGFGPGAQIDVVPALDWRVMAWSLSATSVACLGCGLAPLRSLSRLGLAALVETAESTTRRGGRVLPLALQSTYMGVTVALVALALQTAGTSLARTGRDLGFDRDRLAFASVRLERADADLAGAVRVVEDRLRASPGVEAVAHSSALPFSGEGAGGVVEVDGTPVAASTVRAGAGYFETLGIRRLRGRLFAAEDYGLLPSVAVISETAARRWFPAGDSLGRTMVVAATPVTVVGVVRDVDHGFVMGKGMAAVYVPASDPVRAVYLLVRGRPPVTLRALRTALGSLEPGIETVAVDALTRFINQGAFYPVRAAAAVGVALALVTSAAGLLGQYAVVAMTAVRRRRETAVRRALGAGSGSVVWELAGRQVPSWLIGSAAGAGTLLATRHLVEKVLSGALRVDAGDLIAAVTLLLAVSAASAAVAAVRAIREEPSVALRDL